MAVHGRPAAFEGSDGMSYSVAIEADATGDSATAAEASLGSMSLADVRAELERLIAARAAAERPARKWWDAMREEG